MVAMGNNKTIGERMNGNNNGIPITCEYCGYFWTYNGNMQMATCPSCSNKNDVTENRTDKDESSS
jgi:rubrerythrin